MSDIATKLTYLNTTKTKIKDSINLTGAGITTEPFRQYAVKLKDAYVDIINNGTDTLYNNFPKVNGSGTDLSLTPTYEAPMNIDLNGNTYQKTTSIAQGDEYDSPSPDHPQDINVVSGNNTIYVRNKNLKSDGTIYTFYFNATTFSSGNRTLCIPIEANTTYYIKKPIVSNRFRVCLSNAVPSTSTSVNEYQDVSSLTETSITNTNYAYLNIFFYQTGETYTEQELYDCLNIYTQETAYPINLPVENLFDKDNANITNFYSTATAFNQNNSAVTIIIPIQENNNYTISSTNRSLIDTSANVTYTSEIIDSTSDTYLQRTMWTSTDNSLTTTAPIGAKYMYCYVKWTTNQTDIDNCLATIQLEKGSKANTYTPYGTTPIEMCNIGTYEDSFIRNTGKNIYNKDTSQSYKWLTYQGVIQDSTDPNIVSAFIKVKNGSQYVFSGIPTGTYTLRVCSYTGTTTSTFKTQLVSNLDNVRTFTADADYIVFAIGNADATILNTIQLEQNNEATSYEPYGSGEWYKKANIGKVVLNGSESWQDAGTNRFNCTNKINDFLRSINNITYVCNNYQAFVQKNTNSDFNTLVANASYGFDFNSGGGTDIRIKDINYDEVSDYKTWLSTHNTEIRYVLTNTTYTKITYSTLLSQLEAIYNAKSKNGTTNISQENNDLPFNLTISALEKE